MDFGGAVKSAYPEPDLILLARYFGINVAVCVVRAGSAFVFGRGFHLVWGPGLRAATGLMTKHDFRAYLLRCVSPAPEFGQRFMHTIDTMHAIEQVNNSC